MAHDGPMYGVSQKPAGISRMTLIPSSLTVQGQNVCFLLETNESVSTCVNCKEISVHLFCLKLNSSFVADDAGLHRFSIKLIYLLETGKWSTTFVRAVVSPESHKKNNLHRPIQSVHFVAYFHRPGFYTTGFK